MAGPAGFPSLPPIDFTQQDHSVTTPTATSGGRTDGLDLSAGSISGPATGGASSSARATQAGRGLPSGSHHWVNYALVGIAALVALKLAGGRKCKNC